MSQDRKLEMRDIGSDFRTSSDGCSYSNVRNIAVNHTFSINKARRDLGFCPKRYSLVDSVDQYLMSRPPGSSAGFREGTWSSALPHLLLLMVGLGMALVMLCVSLWLQ